MKGPKRLRRKDPPRVAPVRNFANLYRQPESLNGDANLGDPGSSPKPRGAESGRSRTADGVSLAYRVIEKHISDGRKAAQQFNTQPYGGTSVTAPFQALLDRIIRYQNELVPLWLDLLGALSRTDLANATHLAETEVPAREGVSTSGGDVSVEIASMQAAEVWLNLQPRSDRFVLATPGLHSLESSKPPLTDVRFVPGRNGDRNKFSIKIPTRQPAGIYSGVVIDSATGQARGTLSVRIANNRPAGGKRS